MSDVLKKLREKKKQINAAMREAELIAGGGALNRGQEQRDRMARRSRENSNAVSNIGKAPECKDPVRRESCRLDLHKFLVTYFPNSTGLKPFGPDQVRAIKRIENCWLFGGLFGEAMPRGYAKTSILEGSTLWATLYGHRKFIPIFGANADSAENIMESIKSELIENDLLFEDFPEICHPVRALERRAQRADSQHIDGVYTRIEWGSDTIVFPTVEGAPGSGAILTSRGITAASRGMKHKRSDGTQQRPDGFVLDDPQTDEVAASPLQVKKLMNTIKRSILKLGGHAKKIAGVMAATVIERNDLVDQLLNPKLNPAWQSERIKMVKSWATAQDEMWLGRYAEIRNTYNPDDPDDQRRAHRAATDYYRANREAMDAGCEVSWEHCFDPDVEISAIQHAYNALIDDGMEVFASEFQNEPLDDERASEDELRGEQVMGKLNNLPRGTVPLGADFLTAHIDVMGKALYWVVCAWSSRFDGYVVDYGTYPDQGKPYFALRDIKKSLSKVSAGAGLEGAIYAGLETLTNLLVDREWSREDGSVMRMGLLMIDANWGPMTNLVYQFCRQTKHAGVVMPGRGRYYGATSTPISEYRKKPGERIGLNWIIPATAGRHAIREVRYDTNAYKSFIVERIVTPMGDRGCLSLFGRDAELHRMFADHLTAEYPVKVEARGRSVTEWKLRLNRENHFLDNIVGNAVAASVLGCSLVGVAEQRREKKRRKTFAETRGMVA